MDLEVLLKKMMVSEVLVLAVPTIVSMATIMIIEDGTKGRIIGVLVIKVGVIKVGIVKVGMIKVGMIKVGMIKVGITRRGKEVLVREIVLSIR